MRGEKTGNRRRFLAALSTTPLLAGCLGSNQNGATNDAQSPVAANQDTADRSPETPLAHIAAKGVADEPILGPDIGQGEATVIAFEDPSCHACQSFETETFPELRSKLIDPGRLSFVYRTFPHVQQWAMSATQILEATYAQEAAAFWSLKSHFYENQGSFSTDNIFSKSQTYLEGETDVDAAMVIDEAKQREYDSTIESDSAVRKEANVSSTPTFFLFRDAEYRSRVSGSQSYSVFKNSLGL